MATELTELTDEKVLDICIETLQHDVRYINQPFNTYYRNHTDRIVSHAATLLSKPSCWKGMLNCDDMRERLLAAVDIPDMLPIWLKKGHTMALANVGYSISSLEKLEELLDTLDNLPYEGMDNKKRSDYESSHYTGWLDYIVGLSSILAGSVSLGTQRAWWLVRIVNEQALYSNLDSDMDDVETMLQRWDPQNQQIVAWLLYQNVVKSSANDPLVAMLEPKMKNIASMHQQLQQQMGLSIEEYAQYMENYVEIATSPPLM
jgi:hypothetical protein